MNSKSKKWIAPGLVFLIFIAILVFIHFTIGLGVFQSNLKNIFLNTFSQSPFRKQSEVSVSIIDSNLKMNFEIIDEDKPVFRNFVSNWFGVDDDIKTLDFAVDQNVIQAISPILPVKLNLKVTDKSLTLKSQYASGLKTAMTGTDINFATGSGKLKVKYAGPLEYQLKIDNPEDIAVYATASGMLVASNKIEGLFKSLPQVATIELDVSGKNINGKVVLR